MLIGETCLLDEIERARGDVQDVGGGGGGGYVGLAIIYMTLSASESGVQCNKTTVNRVQQQERCKQRTKERVEAGGRKGIIAVPERGRYVEACYVCMSWGWLCAVLGLGSGEEGEKLVMCGCGLVLSGGVAFADAPLRWNDGRSEFRRATAGLALGEAYEHSVSLDRRRSGR
jgi:hypothetical protein